MENKKFENGWKKALEGAESAPSESRWSSIEASLLAGENMAMKRSIRRYQLLAAAAVLFAIAAGAFGLYNVTHSDGIKSGSLVTNAKGKELANSDHTISTPVGTDNQRPGKVSSDATETKRSGKTDASGSLAADKQAAVANSTLNPEVVKSKQRVSPNATTQPSNNGADKEGQAVSGARAAATTRNTIPVASGSTAGAPTVEDHKISGKDSHNSEEDHAESTAIRQQDRINRDPGAAERTQAAGTNVVTQEPGQINAPIDAELKQTLMPQTSFAAEDTSWNKTGQPDTSALVAQAPAPIERAIIEADADPAPPGAFWISIGGSKGNYTPGLTSFHQTNLPTSNGVSVGTVSSVKAGTFITAGILAGRYVGAHLSISAGLNYMSQSSYYVPHYASSNYLTANASTFTAAPTYQLDNRCEFISVPIQVGYRLSGSRAAITINGGTSPNFFVRNSISDPSGRLASYSDGPGAKSPYRSVNWYGLLNAEVSYRLGARYRFALVPGMRYALNSSLKSNADRPFILDLGVRLNYIIR